MNSPKLYRLRILITNCTFLSLLFTTHALATDTSRVVSVAGALTEIIYELDKSDSLVGVDTTSQWPAKATELPQVGYQRALSAEGILSLSPSLVVGTADAGPEEVLQQLNDAGVQVETFPRDYSMQGLYNRISQLGVWFDRKDQAATLTDNIRQQFDLARSKFDEASRPKVVFLLGTEAGSSMAAGENTAAHAMISYSGGINVMQSYSGYKPSNAEALIQAAPDFILVAAHGQRSDDNIVDAVSMIPGVSLTPAGRDGNIIVVDALKFLGFGPRTGDAILEVTEKLHSGS